MSSLLSLVLSCVPCVPCFPSLSTPTIYINNAQFQIIRLLGEGGFSYVYLVHQTSSQAPYALKKISCPFGTRDETYKNAIREIKNYHRFTPSKTPYVIQSIDENIVTNPDGSRQIYILLPYFTRSLQDIINEAVLNNSKLEEREILKVFLGVCRGLDVMHNYKTTASTVGRFDRGGEEDDEEDDDDGGGGGGGGEDDPLLNPTDTEANSELASASATEMSELVPYAHHDLKPANVMISAEGLAVLVDLGSCSRARIHVTTRQQALTLTDFAQEHCTLPYRAPELMDVETGSYVTEATDIWSLGCLLYSCCFGYSPFEKLEADQGANLNLAIARGKYSIPENQNGYSEDLIDIIRKCLQLKPEKRPTTKELIETALELSRKVGV
ncbi:uncharacterized protein LODBEIA_P59570 [Lodderomyces beijingensis]|uniref:non-specific serine/threonine protein kinase n=1 Tax=Lodderomyces beijingensis TaxID=1775926 RepID=A0ABP0ZVC8_9ASCO